LNTGKKEENTKQKYETKLQCRHVEIRVHKSRKLRRREKNASFAEDVVEEMIFR
jgi:hypothetical protein